jgi:predicted amidohydrolase
MRVGYYQFRPLFGNRAANLARVIRALSRARADLIVLPELAFTGYFFAGRAEARALAEEPRRSPIVEALSALCAARGFHVVTGFAERARDKVFNSSLLIGPAGVVHLYRKIHLFNDEKIWFDPGDTPLRAVAAGGARIGMMICFDWFFPETARTLALEGAQVIAHPSNLVFPWCQQAMLTRCLENGVFAITANRIGEDRRPHGRLRFTGMSQIAAPRGRLMRRAPVASEELRVVEIDPAAASDKRVTRRNDLLRDRRPRFYS